MGTLSIGNDNITASEQAIFLQYLNLAHLELYRCTANLNPNLLYSETLANNAGDNVITLSYVPFLVNSVYIPSLNSNLIRRSRVDQIACDPDSTDTGNPTHFIVVENTIQFAPAVQTGVFETFVWYVPNPGDLLISTPQEEIPYPAPYHQVLADGALYYLFQDTGGFKNVQKEAEANIRWERGKSKLLSYLYNSSGTKISTFRNV